MTETSQKLIDAGLPCDIVWIEEPGIRGCFSVKLLDGNGEVISQTSFQSEAECEKWLRSKAVKYYPSFH